MRIPTLDLFSGIGGFSLALNKHCRTIGYCEKDKTCCEILMANMDKKRIDRAIIYPDVCSLGAELIVQEKPIAVTMGFPCPDISAAGLHAGIQGPQSRLFFEAMRIISKLPTVEWVLMENSPFILRRGLDMVEQAFTALGFNLESTIVSASDLGAWHQRKRWFGLAWRRQRPPLLRVKRDFWWTSEPVQRMLAYMNFDDGKRLRLRNERLGNAVVPECVKFAFWILSNRARNTTVNLPPVKSIDLKLVFDDGHQEYRKKRWGTPCFSPTLWYVTRLGDRTSCVLTTQLYYEKGSRALVKRLSKPGYRLTANPNFVEWLQGYPFDWTLTDKAKATKFHTT